MKDKALHFRIELISDMKRLTTKEKEIMDLYWEHGPMFVKELLEYYDEPRPHFNTLSTTVRILRRSMGVRALPVSSRTILATRT